MILKEESLKGKLLSDIGRLLLIFSLLLCYIQVSPKKGIKNKSPDVAHQGFVVAGAGFEPTAFGL